VSTQGDEFPSGALGALAVRNLLASPNKSGTAVEPAPSAEGKRSTLT
jgi:hypothetical protein